MELKPNVWANGLISWNLGERLGQWEQSDLFKVKMTDLISASAGSNITKYQNIIKYQKHTKNHTFSGLKWLHTLPDFFWVLCQKLKPASWNTQSQLLNRFVCFISLLSRWKSFILGLPVIGLVKSEIACYKLVWHIDSESLKLQIFLSTNNLSSHNTLLLIQIKCSLWTCNQISTSKFEISQNVNTSLLSY